MAWWAWAWATPQATAWDPGALYVVARRAQLEDDLAALTDVPSLDLDELLGTPDHEAIADTIRYVVSRLKALAGGTTTVMREMRELDNRLGLNPKALADLRWTIGDETSDEDAPAAPAPPVHLRAV